MATEENEDNVLESLKDLADEAKSAHATFKRKLDAGGLAPEAVASELGDLLSLFADLALATYSAHGEHFEWAGEVDDDIEMLKEQLGPESALLPEDAQRLKETILALQNNLRIPAGSDDDVPRILAARASEAVAFIDSIIIEEGDEDEDEEITVPTN